MNTSAEKVKQFLETEYIHNEEMGSPDLQTAVRDILTDLIHICKEEGVEIGQKVESALEVYYIESGDIYNSSGLFWVKKEPLPKSKPQMFKV